MRAREREAMRAHGVDLHVRSALSWIDWVHSLRGAVFVRARRCGTRLREDAARLVLSLEAAGTSDAAQVAGDLREDFGLEVEREAGVPVAVGDAR